MLMQKGSSRSCGPVVEFGSPGPDRHEVLARMERARRNSRWLQEHWTELLPGAAGKFVAVAAEQAFIANSPEEAWAWARQTHPKDDTATVQYVNPGLGPGEAPTGRKRMGTNGNRRANGPDPALTISASQDSGFAQRTSRWPRS